MLERPTILSTLFLAGLAVCLTLSGAPARAEGPSTYALLIGVSQYKPSGLADLDGPVNDITLIRKVLETRFGVQPGNIQALPNAAATHSAIAAAFTSLKAKVKPGDFVYVHYSGHGSTAIDENDRRGQDQTWVSFGSRRLDSKGLDGFDVLDKEIGIWLRDLAAISTNIIFVSDSCHSATVARGRNRGVRSADRANAKHPLLGKLAGQDALLPGIRIGAARDFESAVEFDPVTGGPCDDSKRCNGVFTWYWAQALERAQPGDSWQDVFGAARALITTQPGVFQRPQIEGDTLRQVFGGGFSAAKPVVAVIADSAPDDLRLDAGAVSGVTVGSVYEVTTHQPVGARLEVTSVDPTESKAKTLSGRLKRGDQVVEVQHAYTLQPTKLFVGSDFTDATDRDLVRQLKTAAEALPGFVVLNDSARADLWLWVSRPANRDRGTNVESGALLPKPYASSPPQAWVISPQGRLLHKDLAVPLEGPDAVARTVSNLQKLTWAREVRRLGGHGNDTPVTVSVFVSGGEPGAAQQRDIPLSDLPGRVKFGQRLSFELVNADPNVSWYAYLFAVKPNAAVQRIHPQRIANEDEARLDPKERWKVQADYILDEAGEDSVVALVTERPLNPLVIERPGYQARGDGPRSQLEAMVMSSAKRRGQVEVVSERWGGLTADLTITRLVDDRTTGGEKPKSD